MAVAFKSGKANVKVEQRNVVLYSRVRPSVKAWYEAQARENECAVVDVIEEIAEMFKTGRIQVIEPTNKKKN